MREKISEFLDAMMGGLVLGYVAGRGGPGFLSVVQYAKAGMTLRPTGGNVRLADTIAAVLAGVRPRARA